MTIFQFFPVPAFILCVHFHSGCKQHSHYFKVPTGCHIVEGRLPSWFLTFNIVRTSRRARTAFEYPDAALISAVF